MDCMLCSIVVAKAAAKVRKSAARHFASALAFAVEKFKKRLALAKDEPPRAHPRLKSVDGRRA